MRLTRHAARAVAQLPSASSTIYVSTGGADANPGTVASPKRHINTAMSAIAAGGTVIVRAGTYNEAVSTGVNGTANARITLRPYPGESVIVDGTGLAASTDLLAFYNPYTTVTGITVQNSTGHGVIIYNTHDCQLINCTVTGSTSGGCWVGGDSVGLNHDNLVQGCTIFNNCRVNAARSGGGWPLAVGSDTSDNNSFIGNMVYQNYGEGIDAFKSANMIIVGNTVFDNYSMNIYLDNAPNATVSRNLVYSTGDSGYFISSHPAEGIGMAIETATLQRPLTAPIITNNILIGNRHAIYYGAYGFGGGAQNAVIANNTIINPSSAGPGDAFAFEADAGHSGNVVRNNLCYSSVSRTMATAATGFTYDHNSWFNASTKVTGTGDVTADPKLVNPGTLVATDYHLQGTSPCLGAGVTVSAVNGDFFGTARSGTFSIGASV